MTDFFFTLVKHFDESLCQVRYFAGGSENQNWQRKVE